jgi:hypothetical protein
MGRCIDDPPAKDTFQPGSAAEAGDEVVDNQEGGEEKGGGMKYEIVFLDMDGVLCDFIRAAHEVHGRGYVHSEYPKGAWEIADHWGIPVNDFWAGIEAKYDFWESLEPYPWLNEMLAIARQAGEKVKLLTSPSNSPLCYYGKRAWCDTHVPRDIELIICKSKALLATPNRLLIDDGDHNMKPWLAAQGDGILFPQPWNENCDLRHDPIGYVRERLNAYSAI